MGGGGGGPLFSGFQNEAQPWPIPSPKPCILWSRNPEPETPKHCCRMLSLVRGTFTHAPQSKAKQNRSRPGAKTLNRKKLPRSSVVPAHMRCKHTHYTVKHWKMQGWGLKSLATGIYTVGSTGNCKDVLLAIASVR